MNWARVKTIMIVLLLAVNAFLLTTYIIQDNEYRRDELATRSDVCAILKEQGIEVSEELIPLDSVILRSALLRNDGVNHARAAGAILGGVVENRTEEGTVYTGDAGNILFSQNSFSLVYSSGKMIRDAEDAKDLARDISRKLELSADSKKIECISEGGGYTAKIPQSFSGMHVFNYDISAKISESGSVIAYGKTAGNGSLTYTDTEVMSASSMLLEFCDTLEEKNEALRITDIVLGYFAATPAPNVISLTPAMKIVTASETFYISAETGDLLEF